LAPFQKTLRPPWCPKLVTSLLGPLSQCPPTTPVLSYRPRRPFAWASPIRSPISVPYL